MEALIKATGGKPTAMYRRACPWELLRKAAINALEGTQRIGCRIARDGSASPIRDLLNSAWQKFWTAPSEYHAWEREAIADLKRGVEAHRFAPRLASGARD